MSVPQYQNVFRIVIWLFFLFVYSQAGQPKVPFRVPAAEIISTVRQPLEMVDPHHDFDIFEGLLYVMALAFSFEGMHYLVYLAPPYAEALVSETHTLYTTLKFFTWRAFGFWTIVGLITNTLIITAFVLRIMGIFVADGPRSELWHYRSFQVLACVSPFLW